jgi:tetratricopeptide (TPR) repeat protein
MYHRAIALEPYNAQSIADIGFIAFSRRRYAEAYRWYDSATTMDTASWQHPGFRSLVRLHLGDVPGALADARLAARLNTTTNGRLTDARLAMAEAAAGDTAAARARLAPFLADYARADTIIVRSGFELAMALMAVGDSSRALEVIERTRPRGAWLWSYLVFPEFDPLRANPRFRRVYEEARPAGASDPW